VLSDAANTGNVIPDTTNKNARIVAKDLTKNRFVFIIMLFLS